MSTKLATIVADFRTTLATEIAVGGEGATLQSFVDDDGVTLPNGPYLFTLDGDAPAKEHIFCTLTAGVLSAIKSVSRQGVQTVGVARKHRIGASVVITDFAHLMYINNLLTGADSLNASTPLKYDANPTLTLDAQLATVKFVNDTAIAGGAIGSHSTPGIYLKATTVETIAGTDTNGTYTYVIPVGLTKATTVGAADSGKLPILNPSGLLATEFIDYVRTWVNIQSFTANNLQITTDADSANDPVRLSFLQSQLSGNVDKQPYGNGADGAVTFDGSTTYAAFSSLVGGVYTLTRDVYATTIVLSGTAIVDEANAEAFASVSITRTGTAKFRNNGNAASSGTGGVTKAGITLPGQVAGGNGGNGTNNNSQGGAGSGGTAVTFAIVGASSGGGAGGPGSGGGPGAGGGGGAAPLTKKLPRTVDLATRFFDYVTGSLALIQTSSGAGGGGGGWGTGTSGSTGGSGGGGGAPAGIVKVSAPVITDSGTGTMFEAIGGAGAAGSAASGGSTASGGGGGGGGNGGVIIRVYHTLTGTATTDVSGGAGGAGGAGAAGGNAGVAGTAGTAGAVYDIVV